MKNLRDLDNHIESVRLQFGSRIRELRIAAKLTQKSLAKKAKLNHSYLSEIERGMKSASLDTIAVLAKALGVSPADLLPGGVMDEKCFRIAKWLQDYGSISFIDMIEKMSSSKE